jgi:uncharacterized cupredoxin-like copper-binding protein
MNRWSLLWLVALAVLATGLLAVACGDDEDEGPATDGQTPIGTAEVHVDLDEWSIEADKTTAPAGNITFKAENHGTTTHELEVFTIGSDVDIARLPAAGAKADPEGAGAEEIGEIKEEDLPGGAEAEATFDLEPGRYLMICNVPGHYEQGMYAELTAE